MRAAEAEQRAQGDPFWGAIGEEKRLLCLLDQGRILWEQRIRALRSKMVHVKAVMEGEWTNEARADPPSELADKLIAALIAVQSI